MPSKQQINKDRQRQYYEKRKSSFHGSEKSADIIPNRPLQDDHVNGKNFIPNRPLQGEMIRDCKRVLGRSRTYP